MDPLQCLLNNPMPDDEHGLEDLIRAIDIIVPHMSYEGICNQTAVVDRGRDRKRSGGRCVHRDVAARSNADGVILRHLFHVVRYAFGRDDSDDWLRLTSADGRGIVDFALSSNVTLAQNLKEHFDVAEQRAPPGKSRRRASGQDQWRDWASGQDDSWAPWHSLALG